MNKAAFLNIIRQVAPIQDQEVEDLEELVASFPYCQTAHILLAKAAYDRGSMLSTQKLRRAAAHASNRQLLKRIVHAAPPVLYGTQEPVVLEEESSSDFTLISGNEAKNAFPDVAPEEGILQAIDSLTEDELLLDAEVDSPIEIEEPEQEQLPAPSIEEPLPDDQEDAPIEEPTQDLEEAFLFEATVSEVELPQKEILIQEQEQANEEQNTDLTQPDTPTDQDPYFIEYPASEGISYNSDQETATNTETPSDQDNPGMMPVLLEEASEVEQAVDVTDAFADLDNIASEDPQNQLVEDALEVTPFGPEEVMFDGEPALSIQEEGEAEQVLLNQEDKVLEAEIEADFITNAVQTLTTAYPVRPRSLEEVIADESEISSPELGGTPETSFFHEVLEEDSLQEPLTAELLEEDVIFADRQEVDYFINTPLEEDSLALKEEDELFSLMQIDSLATLTAPIPSVNLTHAEIISELTSQPEPLAFTPEEAIIQEEAVHVAIHQEEPVLISPELVEFVAELEGGQATADPTGSVAPSTFPMLQAAPVPMPLLEAGPEKDPYLSIFYHNSLAYWMDSSRMGETIQLRDELTTSKPYYFQPDLILEHVKGNGALEQVVKPVAKLDVQLSIIDQFLKSDPKLKSMAHSQLKSEPQEDLSAKSSKIKKNLASENLALIFIKQGKHKKALKIYEQLIVKFPEKKSYFAEQIEKLRNEL